MTTTSDAHNDPWTAFGLGILGGVRAGMLGRDWLRRRPIRIATAAVLGAVAGIYASTLMVFGWVTATLITIWFAWRHRTPDQRPEIVWLSLGEIASFVLFVRR